MFKYFLFIFCALIMNMHVNTSKLCAANDSLYDAPHYNSKWADVYIGVGYVSLADISTYSAGNPEWGALYNPLKLLNNYGFNFNVGIRPLEWLPVLGNFRFEGEWQYRESRYKILADMNKAGTWINKSKIPPCGKIYLKGVGVINGYYDFRMISEKFYPYVGLGAGMGNLGIRHVDFSVLPSGIGEEYMGYKSNVPLVQFMGGFQYDTKILKTSVFFEYRYASSGKITARPTYNGFEAQKNKEEQINSGLLDQDNDKPVDEIPEGYIPPAPKKIGYKAHAVMFGIKYYLY